MKKICILGSTGSIGLSTLDVIRQHPQYFQADVLVTNKKVDLLAAQISEFKPRHVIIFDKQAYSKFQKLNTRSEISVGLGLEGLARVFMETKPDVFVNAFVGFAGLEPTVRAIKAGIDIALANKETLVVAGSLVTDLIKKYKVNLFPIDSEHSAIWQCLAGEEGNHVKRLILTASGGPFRNMNPSDLSQVTPEKALAHPNWEMGPKITIDSATMMNKGLEVIEAYWLYGVPLDSIQVVIHPQSIIHSMVEFEDKSVKAQLGVPDMRIPIQYALSYPHRYPIEVPAMDLLTISTLSFEQPDLDKFPCLNLAYEALRRGKTFPAVLNAANELAVSAFLENKIRFTDIPVIIERQMEKHQPLKVNNFENLLEVDAITRENTRKYIDEK
jgi:1-deoxy-D-xylulose-5-phosphate reductoisomerase